MRLNIRLGSAVAVATLALALPRDAGAGQAFENQTVDRMFYQYVIVPGGVPVTFETSDLSAGADPVMHLWDWSEGEVAYDDDSGVGTNARITHVAPTQRLLVVVVRAADNFSHGSAELLRDGELVTPVTVGGLVVDVNDGSGYTHEAVIAPGGPSSPWMVALDGSDHLVDLDFSGGVGTQPRVQHASTSRVQVGTVSGAGGPVHIYSNDSTDFDGDGLGWGLENALGTCDWLFGPGCSGVHNLADSDRDGLPDAAEVFGVEDLWNPQYLPRWGASPTHKDAFVEVDYYDVFSSNPFDEARFQEAQSFYFDDALADEVLNRDGEDGIRLHVDIGVKCQNASLCGDWGGTNAVPESVGHGDASDQYRAAIRDGLFRYAVMGYSVFGGGQATGDHFTWKGTVTTPHMDGFAHELGHTFGLAHHGHDDWGEANGKPNYRSVMNYAFVDDPFSHGDREVVVNPAGVDESAGVGADASYLSGAPWRRLVGDDEEVDWDFSQDFTGGGLASTRAPVTYVPSNSTGAFVVNERDLHSENDLAPTTPDLVRGDGGRMYAFYIDDGRVWYRSAAMNGALYDGSCPGGGDIGDDCTVWSSAYQVPTVYDARGVSALAHDGTILLAYRTSTDYLRTIRATGSFGAALTGWTGDLYQGAFTDREPELSMIRVDPEEFGQDVVVGLFYRNKNTGHYRWRSMVTTGAASIYRGDLLDPEGNPLMGDQSPTFVGYPYDQMATEQGTACGALTDQASRVAVHCYDRSSGRFYEPRPWWNGPRTSAKPGLAFHAYRSWAGTPLDPTRGALWLTVVEADADYDYVDTWISDPISDDPEELLADAFFPSSRAGFVGYSWTNMVDGAGLALYDDASLGAMKGLWIRQDGSDQHDPPKDVVLRFLPLADGTFNATLRDGNDFHVMEQGICRKLAGSSYCGPSAWGL